MSSSRRQSAGIVGCVLLLWILGFVQVQPSCAFAYPAMMRTEFDEERLLNFEFDFGGIPNDPSACRHNTELLSQILQYHASNNVIQIGPTLQANATSLDTTYHFYPGVFARYVENTTILVDSIMRFERPNSTTTALLLEQDWKDQGNNSNHVLPACWMMDQSRNVTITSLTQNGVIDGRGSNYWRVPFIGYVEIGEHRPRLLRFDLSSQLLIEHITFQDSPYHTIYLQGVEDVTIRHISIVARRTPIDGHSLIDLSAFNTDGIDVGGTNVHVHDVDIWTQDDCIAVKDNQYPPYESTNMLVERVNCSGLGLVVGSIGRTLVRNITFRDSYLYRSVKGLYLKFHDYETNDWSNLTNRTGGRIVDVRYENIHMEEPLQWPIWIGPAQQSDDGRHPCKANPCSLCWPQYPYAKCRVVKDSSFHNITFTNIHINNPVMSPGVIFGGTQNQSNMIYNVHFDNVRVTKGLPLPISMVDRTITFPGLLRPIVDHYVLHETRTVFGWSISLLLVLSLFSIVRVLLPLTKFWRKRRRSSVAPKETSLSDELEYSSLQASHWVPPARSRWRKCFWRVGTCMIFIIVSTLTTLVMLHHVRPSATEPKWNRHNHYFRCVGVVNGTAGNGTWPIPSCFENVTS
jgi:Glycosyl hydrolases family 28